MRRKCFYVTGFWNIHTHLTTHSLLEWNVQNNLMSKYRFIVITMHLNMKCYRKNSTFIRHRPVVKTRPAISQSKCDFN